MTEPCEEIKRVEQRYEKALDDMEKHYKDVLEQIRAEIEKIPTDYCGGYIGLDKKEVLQIIDKYK